MDNVLKAISDETRRHILDLLRERPLSAGEIAKHFPDISRPAVSQHLAVLREADLVRASKQGRQQVYSLNPAPLRVFWEQWLSRYESLWHERLLTLKQVVEQHQRKDDGQ
ncbi:MAG: metalloregulator ArsR/SmtB family transcription factor [Alicyclobacillus sp.]|nr:metalloregulator ArsR/SmtB family transcription factor [Alicyclobacillus sp.]